MSDDFEKKVERAYRRFQPLAKKYYLTFTRPALTAGARPCLLFLGNHSAGKSSLINWILGGGDVQDTGVAPTDDGFTVLLYGDEEGEFIGPHALARLPEEFRALEVFGPAFLQHLKVKVRPRDFLKSAVVIDSPGMIDSAEGTVSRDYDFAAAVHQFAALSDTVFFLFDPDKPGTTGETMEVLSKSLCGIEFKLRVLLNKCDMFASMYDFARTYGTICWNLGRILHTKDLPKIYTTYSGEAPANTALDLSDFNRHRDEFRTMLAHAGARRIDNIFASAYADLKGLSIRMAVLNQAFKRLFRLKVRNLGLGGLAMLMFGFCGFLTVANLMGEPVLAKAATRSTFALVLSALGGLVAAAATGWAAYGLNKFSVLLARRRLSQSVDAIFNEEFRSELAVGTHDNLRQTWEMLRDETADIVLKAPFKRPAFANRKRRQLDAAAAEILDASRTLDA